MKLSKLSKLCLPVAALLLIGCHVQLAALTTPPPTRVADLNDGPETVVISTGVALAFECSYSDFWSGGPCLGATAQTDDERIARVYPAHVDRLVSGRMESMSPTQQVGFVLVGIAPGTTTLRVRVADMDDEYQVTVE